MDLEKRPTQRAAAEEWNIAANAREQDVTAVEFARAFRPIEFNGRALLAKRESEKKKESMITRKIAPAPKEEFGEDAEVWLRRFPDLRGYRGENAENAGVHLLSPWAFLAHWECRRLPRPQKGADGAIGCLSTWPVPAGPDEPGNKNQTFGPNPEAERRTVLFYPIIGDEDRDFQRRGKRCMRKRDRPMTPAPISAPMPDRQPTKQDKARVYSVHLRPWVPDRQRATSAAPRVVDLGRADCLGDDAARAGERPQTHRRSMGPKTGPLEADYSLAWRTYVRGNAVSKNAARIIAQFMAACCWSTKERGDCDAGADDGEGKPQKAPDQKLALQRVRRILDTMSAELVDNGAKRARGDAGDGAGGKNIVADDDLDEACRRRQQSGTANEAARLAASLRPREARRWPEGPAETAPRRSPRARRRRERQQAEAEVREEEQLQMEARAMEARVKWRDASVDNWLTQLGRGTTPPNDAQK